MKKFTLGMIAGASSLALAVPLLAQVSSAASSGASSSKAPHVRPVPTQACVLALTTKDDAFLSTIDAMMAAEKSATQAHRNALAAAAGITDDAQRQTAVQKADQDFRTAMKAAQDANGSAMKTAMEGVKTSCGNAGMGFRGGRGMPGSYKGGPKHGPKGAFNGKSGAESSDGK